MAVESSLSTVVYYVLAVSRLTADGDLELVSNLTSVAGREVILPCTVSGTGDTVRQFYLFICLWRVKSYLTIRPPWLKRTLYLRNGYS